MKIRLKETGIPELFQKMKETDHQSLAVDPWNFSRAGKKVCQRYAGLKGFADKKSAIG